ncbi:neuropeptides capa receptor-like [Paramacrobiotus metropolitanus]|uniref:neuropeptides capa receptor-like n=1 Tax=Paramacrobiotus metropolitanus TaxID=2943436 RepID=UPI002445BF3E|nr:neuropeptides capa receptor-like [Paramacrobiotus metropolitanus]
MDSLQTDGDANISSEFNMTEYIERLLGEKQLSMSMVIPITVIYTVLFIGGIVGNILTCMVIVRNPYMHTTTNYYLFSLAVSDVLMLLFGLPLEIYSFWVQYPYAFPSFVCSGRAMISEMTTNASIMTISAFTVERYLAICHPISTQTMTSLSRAKMMIGIIWLASLMSAIPYAFFVKVNHLVYPGTSDEIPESAWCSINQNAREETAALFIVYTTVFFVVPIVLLTILYILIARALNKSERHPLAGVRTESSTSDTSRNRIQSRKSIIRMLAAVCVAFVICWAPFHTQRLLWSFVNEWNLLSKSINGFLYVIAGCCYYTNCVINVIIYNLMSHRFREAFREETLCVCRAQRRRRSSRAGSVAHDNALANSLVGHLSYMKPASTRIVYHNPPYRRQSSLLSRLDARRRSSFSPVRGAADMATEGNSVVELYVVSPEGRLLEEGSMRHGSDGTVDPFLGSQYLASSRKSSASTDAAATVDNVV